MARENGTGDQEARKRGAGEQKPSPEAEPSPTAAESIPQQLPAEPREPEPQEEAGDHAALPSKAEEDLDSAKEQLVVRAGKPSSYTSPSDKYSSLI
ncbi:hypothetical protein AAES_47597 [Amazona aestiva]|uniref:Uncharacterized protein n=1 Tax=Amazona aestiva TaxID=12930 RepID=A0A0Q3PTX9_AMAAE|nr:hypothetical protein AAES_47597 [Amazona aestiva]